MIEVEMDSNEIVFASIAEYNIFTPQNKECNNNSMQLYDWLADCATTSHIANQHEQFHTFEPLVRPINGVGNAQTQAKGRGTIKINSKVNGQIYKLTLKDVLYVPNNPHNLLALGHWDKADGTWNGGQGTLRLIKEGHTVAIGQRYNNNLYWLHNFTIRDAETTHIAMKLASIACTFNVRDNTPM